ncbi:MAG TPA: T9SS type A sorting domain-containing protein, partial [Chitinophagales bacterium]|nr:T9SS type A sorting domain-containing protein [Chitinophagales bacterium]HRK29289.1 T9SS type A sorting domain-containing protein [Chitinophagales bacterium]
IGGQYYGNVFETCNVGVSTSNTSATSFLGAIGIYGNWLTDNRVGIQSSGSDVFIAHNTLSGNTAVYPDGGVQMGLFLQGANFDVRINNFTNMFVGLTLLNNGSDADLVEENTFTGNPVGAWVLGDNEGTNFHCNQFVGYFYALLTQDYFNTWGSTPGLLGDQGFCIGDVSLDQPADNAFVNGVLDIFQTIAAPFIYYYRNGTGLVPNVFNAPGAGAVTPMLCSSSNSDIVDCQTWRTVPTGFMTGLPNDRYIDQLLLQKMRTMLEEDHDTAAALALLQTIHTDMARQLQMRHALEKGNIALADSLRNLLASAASAQDYPLQLAMLYRNLMQSGRNFLQLTPEETAMVGSIAQSNTPAAFEAQCIRYLAHGEEYQIPLPPLPQEVLNGYWQMYINFKQADAPAQNTLQIYPNPAKDKLYLSIKGDKQEPTLVKIYCIDGTIMAVKEVPQNMLWELNIQNWLSGIYIIQVVEPNGQLKTYKFVVVP